MLSLTRWGGSGSTALFIHGFGADSQSWIANVPTVTENVVAVGVDLPAHGDSYQIKPGSTLGEIADQVVDTVGSQVPLHLIGHSVGGAIAALCASRLRAITVSMVSPVGLGGGVQTGFIDGLINLEDKSEALALLHSMVQNKRLISDLAANRLLSHLDLPGTRENLAGMARAIHGSRHELEKAFEYLLVNNVPRQVIWGRQDKINPPAENDIESVGGEWHLLEDCGHLPQIECRTGYNTLLKKFISNRG